MNSLISQLSTDCSLSLGQIQQNIQQVSIFQRNIKQQSLSVFMKISGQNVFRQKEYQLQLDTIVKIYEQFQLQYDFLSISLIEERDASRKNQYKFFQKLIQLDEELGSFRNLLKKFNDESKIPGQQNIIDPSRINGFHKKLKKLQVLFEKFKAQKLQRNINEIVQVNADSELTDIYEQLFEKQIYQIYIKFNNLQQNQTIWDPKFQTHLKNLLLNSCQYFLNIADYNFNESTQNHLINNNNQENEINQQDQISQLRIDNYNKLDLGIFLYKQKKYYLAWKLLKRLLKFDQDKIYILYYLGMIIVIKANIYKVNKNYDDAIILYEKAIEANSKFTKAYSKKGKYKLNFKQAKIYKIINDKKENTMYKTILLYEPNNEKILQRQVMWYHSQEFYEDALLKANLLIELNPNNVSYYHNKGCLLDQLGNIYEALIFFDKAIQIRPNSASYNSKGVLLVKLNKFDKAYKSFNEAIQLNPEDYNAYNNIGYLYVIVGLLLRKQGHLDSAIEIFDKAIRINPEADYLYKNKGLVLNQLGLFYEALQSCDKAIQLNPKNSIYYNNKGENYWILGLLLEKLGQNYEALQNYDRAILYNHTDYVTLYNKGLLLEKLDRSEDALKLYDKVLQINPNDSQTYNSKGDNQLILGSALVKLGRNDDALIIYNKALQINPQDYVAYINKGILFEKQGRIEEAMEFYNLAQKFLNPNDSVTYNHKGLILSKLGQLDQAIKHYDKAIQLNPQNDNAYNNKGLILKQLGRIDDAIKQYDRAIQINPNDYITYNNKGSILNLLGKFDEALECYEKAIQLNPYAGNIFLNKGLLLNQQGKTDEALQCFDQAIQLNPQNDHAYNNKGLILKQQDKLNEALQQFDKAISINPKQDAYQNNKGLHYLTVGFLLERLGEFQKALQLYGEAIKLNPKNDIYYNNKGLILEKLGRQEEALQFYDQALQINSKNNITINNKGLNYIIVELLLEKFKNNYLQTYQQEFQLFAINNYDLEESLQFYVQLLQINPMNDITTNDIDLNNIIDKIVKLNLSTTIIKLKNNCISANQEEFQLFAINNYYHNIQGLRTVLRVTIFLEKFRRTIRPIQFHNEWSINGDNNIVIQGSNNVILGETLIEESVYLDSINSEEILISKQKRGIRIYFHMPRNKIML